MPPPRPSKTDPINIVGAGIFGLSTALHLARRGYKDVTVFDKQPYDTTEYSYFKGCDAASADSNKIIRSAYGSQTEYQQLSTEAIVSWKQWNSDLETGVDVPPGMSSEDRVFIQCGSLSLTDGEELPEFEKATVQNMEAAGHHDTQLITTDPKHCEMAEGRGLRRVMDPFQRIARGRPNVGVLDSTGGVAIADKACRVALHKARNLGAKFVFGPSLGAFDQLLADSNGQNIGIKTKDGQPHLAKLTIMACGGWTPSILPELDGICEATAGSVIIYKIPRGSQLWDRFSAENFTTWLWKVRDGAEGGLYGFPRDENGYLKLGYRGTKYTNPEKQADGNERSIPITRWSEDRRLKQIPSKAMEVLRRFVKEYLPELDEEGIEIATTRICWYTDSFDNHFLIDHVPGKQGLFVATGGSGHAFKYLPNVGNLVVDVIEGVGCSRPAVKAWRWRTLGDQNPSNVLMEGTHSSRALGNVSLVDERGQSRARL
jgi:sarcosine oxidase/L-pipecolate oxidase